MAEFLLELLSEEIPARMQARAADDLKRLVCDGLKAAGLAFGAYFLTSADQSCDIAPPLCSALQTSNLGGGRNPPP